MHEPERNQMNDIDPIWTTSRTARQIYALGEVEKVKGSIVVGTVSHSSRRI